MTRDPKHLLPGFATDTLGEAERGELLRAALDDQQLFDALVEEDGLRELLQDPGARQELLAVLEQPTAWERVRAWFERPATLLDLAAVAAVVLAAFVGYAVLSPPGAPTRGSAASRPMGTPLAPTLVAALLELPEAQRVPAGIEVPSRPDLVFRPGEPMHVRVSVRAPARVVLLDSTEGAAGMQAWPGLGLPPALLARPSSGGPATEHVRLEAPSAPGAHRLRLVVAPEDLDLGALTVAALAGAAERLTLVDLRYEVTRP